MNWHRLFGLLRDQSRYRFLTAEGTREVWHGEKLRAKL